MEGLSEEQKQRFYFDNFADLMGSGLCAREGNPAPS